MFREPVRLSWKEKQVIAEDCSRQNLTGGKSKINEVFEWARHAHYLPKKLSYRTVLKIIREKEKI